MYDHLIPTLDGIDAGDRHVAAAAITGGAEVIVTRNLKQFPTDVLARHGLRPEHPDEFVAGLFGLDPAAVCAAVRGQRADLKNPPRTAEELLATFVNNGLVRTAELLRPMAAEL